MSRPRLVPVKIVATVYPFTYKGRHFTGHHYGEICGFEHEIAMHLVRHGLARIIKPEKAEATSDAA